METVNVSEYKGLALESGILRMEDAIKNGIPNKTGYNSRNADSEGLSVLAEIGAAAWLGVDPSTLVLFEARNNGVLQKAKNPDVGNIEVRRGTGDVRVYGKDYWTNAAVLQVDVELIDGFVTGNVHILGWADARKDWGQHVPRRRTELKRLAARPLNTLNVGEWL